MVLLNIGKCFTPTELFFWEEHYKLCERHNYLDPHSHSGGGSEFRRKIGCGSMRIQNRNNNFYLQTNLPQIELGPRLAGHIGLRGLGAEGLAADGAGLLQHPHDHVPLVGLEHLLVAAHVPNLGKKKKEESASKHLCRILKGSKWSIVERDRKTRSGENLYFQGKIYII
jgi:hypothetical protein